MNYCTLFKTYVDDNHCDLCDKRSGYEKGMWKYSCIRVRKKHHPILNTVWFWLKPYAFRMKLCIITKFIANTFFGRNWYVWSNGKGWSVGKMSWDKFMTVVIKKG